MRAIQTTLLGLSLLNSAPLLALDSNTILEDVLDNALRIVIESELGAHSTLKTPQEQEPIEIEGEAAYMDEHEPYNRHKAVRGGPPPWAPAHGYRRKHRFCGS